MWWQPRCRQRLFHPANRLWRRAGQHDDCQRGGEALQHLPVSQLLTSPSCKTLRVNQPWTLMSAELAVS